MLNAAKWVFLCSGLSLVTLQNVQFQGPAIEDDGRQGRNLLDWIGYGTGPDTDPYVARTNAACLNGELAECFKKQALNSFEDFFNRPHYQLSENAKIKRMPENQLRQLIQEPYEFSESPRADESEWDQLLNFAKRKVERFLKSTTFELDFDDEVTERGRYSPRFLDEIVGEIDVIEDKKDSLFKRKQLKKLFIPLLLVLKLFKLKLLLFLPLILGLASFKKFLGFLALIIPGAIAFFNFCKPNFQQGGSFFAKQPQYSPAGVAYPHHHVQQHEYRSFFAKQPQYSPAGVAYPHHHVQQHEYSEYPPYSSQGAWRGNEDAAQNIAYNGWGQYRSNDKNIQAEPQSIKKSILPDS